MKHLNRLLSALVFALTVFCGVALVRHIIQLPGTEVRYALTDVPRQSGGQRDENSWSISKLNLLPQWGRKKAIVSVMIENHEEARPHHSGLEDALIIEEFFVEGLITRFNALFDAGDFPAMTGPVRSLRPYFIDGALPWASVFFHIGGSPEALERLDEFDTITAFNGIYRDTYFTRENNIPPPHDAFLTEDSMNELLGEVEKHSSVPWPPYKTGRAREGSGATMISINFFSSYHDVVYEYDSWRKRYTRKNGRDVSKAKPRNVLILETTVKEIGPFGRLAIAVQGEGDALLFRAGRVYPARWSKESVLEPYVFTNESGDPLVLASGQTWITVVDLLERVDWEE